MFLQDYVKENILNNQKRCNSHYNFFSQVPISLPRKKRYPMVNKVKVKDFFAKKEMTKRKRINIFPGVKNPDKDNEIKIRKKNKLSR